MRNTTQTPTKPTTGSPGFFDSPALSRDARPAPEEAVPAAGKSTRRRAGRKGVDSPVLEHGRPVPRGDASPVRTTAAPVVRGKSVFDSPVSTRRTPTAPPQTTPSASLKPNGRSVFDMPIAASPSTETVKPKRKKTPGTGKKPRREGKKVPDDVAGSEGDEPEAWYRRASLADVLDELSRCVPLSLMTGSSLTLGQPIHLESVTRRTCIPRTSVFPDRTSVRLLPLCTFPFRSCLLRPASQTLVLRRLYPRGTADPAHLPPQRLLQDLLRALARPLRPMGERRAVRAGV